MSTSTKTPTAKGNKGTTKGNSSKPAVEVKLDAKNKETIKSELSIKKFRNVEYDTMSTKEQKRFRAKIRHDLFKIVDERIRMKASKELTPELEKKNFQAFKKYVVDNYTISMKNVDMIYAGNEEGKKKDWDGYIAAFRTYLEKTAEKKAEKAA